MSMDVPQDAHQQHSDEERRERDPDHRARLEPLHAYDRVARASLLRLGSVFRHEVGVWTNGTGLVWNKVIRFLFHGFIQKKRIEHGISHVTAANEERTLVLKQIIYLLVHCLFIYSLLDCRYIQN